MIEEARLTLRVQEQEKTIVLLDVDGVVNFWAPRARLAEIDPADLPDEFDVDLEAWYPLRVPKSTAHWVRTFVAQHDVRWCTAWRELANRFVSPLLRIPPLTTIDDFPNYGQGADWKFEEVAALIEETTAPIVWIEDFEASWMSRRYLELASERVHLVDTSAFGYLRPEMLEHLFLKGVL